jgi:hypothetical protein
MDCSTGKVGKVKGVRIGIQNSDSKINNTEERKTKQNKKTPGTATTKMSVCLLNVLELFLWCSILVLVHKW